MSTSAETVAWPFSNIAVTEGSRTCIGRERLTPLLIRLPPPSIGALIENRDDNPACVVSRSERDRAPSPAPSPSLIRCALQIENVGAHGFSLCCGEHASSVKLPISAPDRL